MNPYYRPPSPPSPFYRQESSVSNTTISVILLVVIVIIIISIIVSSISSSSSTTTSNKVVMNVCNSRKGNCNNILNNTNGKMCFAKFDKNDGRYIIQDPMGTEVWSNKISNPEDSQSPYTLKISPTGNLEVSDSYNKVVWGSDTTGVAPFALKMQDDCNLVLYDSEINKLWESGTSGKNSM
jgi:hypothetical protein